ncbi:MAG: hypothetical protein PGN09_14045 [Sphingomonas fennica]
MAKLVTLLNEASGLIGKLFDRSEQAGDNRKLETAFRVDALSIVTVTQELAVKPAHGLESAEYDAPLKEVREARKAVEAIGADAASIHHAHLETVQVLEAMRAVTA